MMAFHVKYYKKIITRELDVHYVRKGTPGNALSWFGDHVCPAGPRDKFPASFLEFGFRFLRKRLDLTTETQHGLIKSVQSALSDLKRPLNVYSSSEIISLSLLNSILMARFLKQRLAQTCLKETDNGKLQQFNYSRSHSFIINSYYTIIKKIVEKKDKRIQCF